MTASYVLYFTAVHIGILPFLLLFLYMARFSYQTMNIEKGEREKEWGRKKERERESALLETKLISLACVCC